jgi:threonine-phosphate decarboxylase
MDVPTFINRLGERGILVRDCSSIPGLDGSFIRISVRTWWHNRRLIKAFRQLLVKK